MSDAARRPASLVFVNREPINVDTLPDNQAFVASDERESGTLETKEIAACSRRPARPRPTST